MSKKYIFKIFIPSTAALLILAVVFGLCFADREVPSLTAQKTAEEPVCVLVIGKDRVSGLSDVIMLASLDEENHRACIMQIPRDTYMLYGDGNHRKINAAAKLLGGEKELCRLLSESLGVSIDGYVSLELDAFRKVVDGLGGVEMELDRALVYSDPEQGLYINLPKGKQVLDGKKAEMLVRYRSGYANGDIQRLDTQKDFMRALLLTVKERVNLLNVYSFADDVLPHLNTDVSAPKLVTLGIKAMKIEARDISFLTLPGEAVRSEVSGASFYIMSAPAVNRVLCENFGKNDNEIDKNKIFVHEEYEKFCKIYNQDRDFEISNGEATKK